MLSIEQLKVLPNLKLHKIKYHENKYAHISDDFSTLSLSRC